MPPPDESFEMRSILPLMVILASLLRAEESGTPPRTDLYGDPLPEGAPDEVGGDRH